MSMRGWGARLRAHRMWIIVPALAFVVFAAWAVSSPVGSSPDDDFHLPSIWCGLGDRPGLCESTGDPATRSVPAPLVGEACFARDSTATGDCADFSADGLAVTDRVNAEGLYPPLFYATMSVFAGPDIPASVLAMRLFNAALFVGFTTAVVAALPRRLRASVVVPLVVTAVPLGLFIVPSTNASSWALLSAGTLWACLVALTAARGRRRILLAALAVAAGVLGAGARADAAAYAVFAIILAAVLTVRRPLRDLAWFAGTAGVIAVVSAAFYLTAGQSAAATTGLPTDGGPLTIDQHLFNLLNAPTLWLGMFGGWGLGWLDTPLPGMVSVLAFAVFVLAVGVGVGTLRARGAVAVVLAVSALWLVPVILLAQSRALVGAHVQPRYILPLAVILVGVAWSVAAAAPSPRLPTAIAVGGSVALTAAAAVALHVNISRYVTGLADTAVILGTRGQWWWPGAPHPMLVWGLAVAATTALLVALCALERRAAGSAGTQEPARVVPYG